MTFAAPLFLLAALAAAIPIVLHMIHRRKAKLAPFSTLRFLKISVEKTRRRKRIHDALLMALRAAVLLLIAAGLARPAVTSLGALWSKAHSAIAIILDNSASMGQIDRDRVRFDTAVAAATQILDQWTDGDQVAMLVTCGPALPAAEQLDRTQDAARQVLGQCRVSYERADLNAKVQRARDLLAKSEAPNKHIYVISDMQKVSWAGDEGKAGKVASGQWLVASESSSTDHSSFITHPSSSNPQSLIPNPSPVPIILIDCNRKPKPNVAVQEVDVEAAAPVAGLPMKATVTLLNASTAPQQPRVELLLDGAKESSSAELNVPPEGRAKHEFQFSLGTGGLHRGEVRLVGEDGSKYDDRRFFTVQVEQGIPMAIVRPQRHEIPYLDDAFYLQQALGPGRAGGSAIQTTVLVADDLLSEPLEKYKLIFCVNLPAPSAEAAERLRAYVAGGGGVLWFCGDNVQPEAYNQMNQQARGQLLPAPLVDVRTPATSGSRDSWRVSFLDKTYPPLGRLVDPPALYESVLVYKHVRMAADKPGTGPLFGGKTSAVDGREAETMDLSPSAVLARLDDGEPLLALRNVGKGKVLMLGVSAHVNWSNLPLRPIFLPLVTRLTFELAGGEQSSHSILAGQPIVLEFPNESRPVGVEVVPPSGETLRLKTERVQGKPGQTFRYANTHQIGVYLLRPLGVTSSSPIAYTVNADPDEADPAKIERQDLEKLLGETPLLIADNPDDLASTFALLREGKSLWGVFLTLVLIGLVFETFLSNRLGPKREDQPAGRSRSA